MADDGGLGAAREALVDVSAAIAARDTAALDRALRIAARVSDPTAVDEVILQAHLFVGFPLALEALLRWRVARPREIPDDFADSPAGWPERGAEVCRRVYGANYDKLRTNVAALHPDLDRWMVDGGYGRVLGRPQLDLATRELCIAALLAVWGTPRQLHSHLRGALNAGATRSELRDAIAVAMRHLEPERARPVMELFSAVVDPPQMAGV